MARVIKAADIERGVVRIRRLAAFPGQVLPAGNPRPPLAAEPASVSPAVLAVFEDLGEPADLGRPTPLIGLEREGGAS